MATDDINELQHAFRFLDVDEELLKILPSIGDYENIPLVSLDEAVIPLESIVPEVKFKVQRMKVNCEELVDNLTRDESTSIELYTLEWQPIHKSLFYILNKTLRSQDRQLIKPWLLYLRLILTALSHLPSTSLIVYRGTNKDLTEIYPKGKTVTWWGFSSCMSKNNLLEKRLFLNKTGNRTLFKINCYSAKNIYPHSLYNVKNEFLLPPARRFTVISSVAQENDLQIIELNEIQPAFDFFKAFSASTEILVNRTIHPIEFQPISTVSLSKKLLPAAYTNPQLEERLRHLSNQSTRIDLKSIKLSDSDMDIIVCEAIVRGQCSELDLSSNTFTNNGILILARPLRKNKVSDSYFSLLYSI